MEQATAVWVTLHMESQNDTGQMPSTITGFMIGETPGSYIFSKVISFDEYGTPSIQEQMNFINRTYVYRCEILANEPDLTMYEGMDGDGLG